ncbi:tetratricopeptide repeat protein [Loigolactobacillus binensis]|uniref:Tetratricopeptide repeat protein n=1 Tax=Loigolactobacillus binensis TaxID=2559922 RepID=A0ABW3EGD4_9LACO|nr:hypothetical protein [Loigolactobacillus binensis]
MFKKFFKNKVTTEPVEQKLTTEERLALQQENEQLNQDIEVTEGDGLIKKYDQLGENYTQLGETDSAITAFEASLKVQERFGAAYNGLLNLYEIKRKEAAEQKNNDEIQKWVTKTDELLNLSKRVMRSNF